MPFVEALELAADLGVDEFGGTAHLRLVLLLEQLQLLFLRHCDALLERGVNL